MIKIVILSDKYQKGTKSQGCPGLLKINDSINLLQYQHHILSNSFIDAELIYLYGFDAKKLLSFLKDSSFSRTDFIYNKDYDNYNECFSLSLIKNKIDSDILIISGYTILSQSFFKNFDRSKSQIFIDSTNSSKLGCIINNNNNIENIFYDLDNRIHSVFYLTRSDVDIFSKLINIKNYNAFLFEIINKCIANGCNFKPTNLSSKSIKYYKHNTKIKLYDKY